MRRDILRVLIISIAFVTVIPLIAGPACAENALEDFSLDSIKGERYDATSVNGKPVVIIIMAEWCKACEAESDELQKAYLAYKDKGVVFFGVFIKSSEDGIKKFVKDNHLSFPVGADKGIAKRLGTFSVPSIFFIQRDGKVVKRYIGPVGYSKLVIGAEAIIR